jgi:ABC-type multidrug transport system fused ATPase/permease subunit
MEKTRQQELTRWLKQQSVISRRWLTISRLLGLISGLLIVAQAWLLARILNHMIMENIPREALLMPFVVLVLVFVLRAWVVWLRERVGFHAGQNIRFNVVAPGLTETKMTKKITGSEVALKFSTAMHALNRIGKAEDVATMVEFLLSEKANFITGQVIAVDGGLSNLQPKIKV